MTPIFVGSEVPISLSLVNARSQHLGICRLKCTCSCEPSNSDDSEIRVLNGIGDEPSNTVNSVFSASLAVSQIVSLDIGSEVAELERSRVTELQSCRVVEFESLSKTSRTVQVMVSGSSACIG